MFGSASQRVVEAATQSSALAYRNGSEGMLATGADGVIIATNEAFAGSRGMTAEKVIRRQASFDAPTLLPKRFIFTDRLRHAIERGRGNNAPLALLFIDLDHFKKVNDGLG